MAGGYKQFGQSTVLITFCKHVNLWLLNVSVSTSFLYLRILGLCAFLNHTLDQYAELNQATFLNKLSI